eukprot:COSAG02_NODE_4016_length_5901_cov_42.404688_2_plen_206_part_00
MQHIQIFRRPRPPARAAGLHARASRSHLGGSGRHVRLKTIAKKCNLITTHHPCITKPQYGVSPCMQRRCLREAPAARAPRQSSSGAPMCLASSARGSGRSSERSFCPALRWPGPCAWVGSGGASGCGSGSRLAALRGCQTGKVRSISAPMVHAYMGVLLSCRGETIDAWPHGRDADKRLSTQHSTIPTRRLNERSLMPGSSRWTV